MIVVSKQTENFIGCLKLMQDLYSKVYNSLYEMYYEQQTDRIIDENFINEYEALKERIEQFLLMSIDDKISFVDSKEI